MSVCSTAWLKFPKFVHKMVRRDWWRFSPEHHYSAKRQQSRCNSVFHICLGLEGNPCSCDSIPLSCKIYNVILLVFPHCLSTQIILAQIFYTFETDFPNIQRSGNCFSTVVELIDLITRLLKKSKCRSL